MLRTGGIQWEECHEYMQRLLWLRLSNLPKVPRLNEKVWSGNDLGTLYVL